MLVVDGAVHGVVAPAVVLHVGSDDDQVARSGGINGALDEAEAATWVGRLAADGDGHGIDRLPAVAGRD